MPDEARTVSDLGSLAVRAARVFRRHVVATGLRVVSTGRVLLRGSVSMLRGEEGGSPRILRGVVDCLARRPDGRVVVVDFKTGARREADRRQLRAYVGAVRLLYPCSPVEGQLVYQGSVPKAALTRSAGHGAAPRES
jgi:hypothetical protein